MTPYSSLNAGSRLFAIDLAKALRARELDARAFTLSSPRAERWQKLGRGPRQARALIYWYVLALPRRLAQIVCAASFDVVVLYRGCLRARSLPLLELLLWALVRARGGSIIYALDDALYATAPRWRYRLRCRFASLVVTGNSEIAAFAEATGTQVARVDGAVHAERYSVRRHEGRDPREPVVIGWTGHDAAKRLGAISHALRLVGGEGVTRLLVVTDRPVAIPGLDDFAEIMVWDKHHEFTIFSEFDVGLLPLVDSEYERGKEAYKAKEYMAAGVPVVCSPVGHCREVVTHGVNGLHARTTEEWVEALTGLTRSPERRRLLGQAGRREALSRWSYRRFADDWELIVRGVMPVSDAARVPND